MLLEAVLGIGSDLGLSATLQHIVDTATALTGARYGALGVLGSERRDITDLFTCGLTEEQRRRVGRVPGDRTGLLDALLGDSEWPPPPNSPGYGTRSTAAPGADTPGPTADTADPTPDPDPATETGHTAATGSFLGVPVRVGAEVFGNLHLAGKRTGPFTPRDLALLRVLAAQAGTAVADARRYETARQRERWIEGAAAVTNALLSGRPAEDSLGAVAEQARLLADAAAGAVLQPTEEGGMEIVAASTAGDPGDLVGVTIAPGSAVLAQLLGGEPVFIDDSATDPRMTTPVRSRFGPSMMLPLRSGGRLIGTLALPRRRGERPYTAADRLLASQFASQAALALVLADAQHDRERLAVYQDRDRIARDLHDLVVQRLFATVMMLESTQRRSTPASGDHALIERALDELDSTVQEVRTTIFALQQPPADAPASFRGRVLRETGGAAALLGFQPSVHFSGAVDALADDASADRLLSTLRGALAAAHRRPGVGAVTVEVSARPGAGGPRLRVTDDGVPPAVVTWPPVEG
ncbi:GAF domain-containing protein [Streptomyces sp. NPDC048717]|uniref:GAF domain-containing protein n=1 Tax=Streptomyces sp. NPDC048717 TaxID=3154928 RepID=UPI003448CBD9